MKCPICKKTMKWKEGLLTDYGSRDMSVGRYYCDPCRVAGKTMDSRAIRKGRRLAKRYEGIDCMDKRFTALPVQEQIGILRERQKHFDKEPRGKSL